MKQKKREQKRSLFFITIFKIMTRIMTRSPKNGLNTGWGGGIRTRQIQYLTNGFVMRFLLK